MEFPVVSLVGYIAFRRLAPDDNGAMRLAAQRGSALDFLKIGEANVLC